MTYYQLRARTCLRLARVFLACGLVLIAAAFVTGPSWLSLALAVVGVQALNLASAEYAERRHYLNRCKR